MSVVWSEKSWIDMILLWNTKILNFPLGVLSLSFFFKDFILFYFFREGKGGREGEKHQGVVAFHGSFTGDLAHNPGMDPDWESNW